MQIDLLYSEAPSQTVSGQYETSFFKRNLEQECEEGEILLLHFSKNFELTDRYHKCRHRQICFPWTNNPIFENTFDCYVYPSCIF